MSHLNSFLSKSILRHFLFFCTCIRNEATAFAMTGVRWKNSGVKRLCLNCSLNKAQSLQGLALCDGETKLASNCSPFTFCLVPQSLWLCVHMLICPIFLILPLKYLFCVTPLHLLSLFSVLLTVQCFVGFLDVLSFTLCFSLAFGHRSPSWKYPEWHEKQMCSSLFWFLSFC